MFVRLTSCSKRVRTFASPRPVPSCSRLLSSSAQRSTIPPPPPSKHYYVTTPIFYVNADPHIGHLHSTLLADIYARYSRLLNPSAPPPILCTGTDEHGLKIQRVAELQGVAPRLLCDSVSERFRELARHADVKHDVFIRTTEERHKVAVQHVWRELAKRGYIYKSGYAGWYAVSDEAYYSENQVAEVVDPATGEQYMASIETGTKVEWMEEENYKFRLSAFRAPLLEWLSAAPGALQPSSRATPLLASLAQDPSPDTSDLSISRPSSRLDWGIRVPGDDAHTIYVWIDALVNYLTAAGYPWAGGEAFGRGEVWPPELMVVGKDIIRFHALYLPAVLLALELPLPRTILAHGHWTMDKYKMSKSRGNVADPFQAMRVWGTDAMRCYLMRVGGNPGVDSDYSVDQLRRFYKKDLVGQLGSLLARISADKLLAKLSAPEMISRMPEELEPEDEELIAALNALPEIFDASMKSYDPSRALASLFAVLAHTNRHLQDLSPWLSTTSPSMAHRALFLASEALRFAGIVLQPFMPSKSEELLDALGAEVERRKWEDLRVGRGGRRSMFGVGKGKHLFPAVLEE